MSKKRIIILGAGLAGLTAAYELQKIGIESIVFEKEKEAGGLCRSKKVNGFSFDYDGHLLHFRHKNILSFISGLLGNNLVRHKRRAAVFSFDRLIPFPFQSNLYALPRLVRKECLKGFLKAHQDGSEKKIKSFKDWIEQNLGKGIERHFMGPYNTKFWTISPEKLTPEWVNGFITVPSLDEIIEGAAKDCRKNSGYNAFFWYPKRGGINELPLALAAELKNIFCNSEVTWIDIKNKKIKLANGSKERFNFLLSTLPLPELPRLIKNMPREIISLCKKLNWNSILNLNLGINSKLKNTHHWIYFPEKRFSFFRVGFPGNFSSSLLPPDKSSLYVETSYSTARPLERKAIIPRIIQDLVKANIISSPTGISIQDINDIKYGYPIYDFNYRSARREILAYLARNNIISFGRYGSWRYMSMEDAIFDGINTKNIFE